MRGTEYGEVAEPGGEEPEVRPDDDERTEHTDEVLIGGEDFVYRQTRAKLANLGDDSDEFRKACDVVRVYIGTLLKTDQVSLLLGAGCSLGDSGVLLGTIPYEVERYLLEKGLPEGTAHESWLTLFYSVVANCVDGVLRNPEERAQQVEEIETSILLEGRHSAPVKKLIRDFEVPANFEKFLSRLHTWSSGILADKIGVTSRNGGKLVIGREDLTTLIDQLTVGLAKACILPVTSGENHLKHHRSLIQRLLTRPLNLRRVALFTLNYDTLLEQAMDSCGVIAVDGFVGSLRRVFRPESYDHDLYFPGETTEGRVHRLDRVMHLYKLVLRGRWVRCDR